MSLAHPLHHPRAHAHAMSPAAAAYPAYPASHDSLYEYYPAHSASPAQDAYEPAYVPDTARAHWHAQPNASSSYAPSDYAASSSSQSMAYPAAYAPAPQHPGLQDAFAPSPSSSTRSYGGASSLTQPSASSTPTLPALQRASWAAGHAPASALYIVDPEPDGAAAPAGLFAQVKTEEDEFESGFIFELASDAPPALPLLDNMPEVPLRATQASKAMRKLMGAFRLDPFAMHNGVKSAASQSVPPGIEVGPLRVPPITFEWQAELLCPLTPPSPRWSPAAHGLHAFEDDDEKWAPPGAGPMDMYADVYDDDAAMDAEAAFQPVMTPAQAVGWSIGYSEHQVMAPASASPSGYPVQPLSGIFNRSASQASISRSLPSLPQPQPSAFYRPLQNYALSPPSAGVPSPPLSTYSQRSTPGSAPDLYYRQPPPPHHHHHPQQHAPPPTHAPSASASMRVPAHAHTSGPGAALGLPPRRAQLEYPQPQTPASQQYASPSPTSFAGGSGGGGGLAGAGRYRDETLGWYRRSAFALEPYTAAACT